MTRERRLLSVQIETYQKPKKGNTHCGDSLYIKETDEYLLCVVADGLGSGEHALAASSSITETAKRHHADSVDELMVKCNEAVKNTRGAAVAILKFYKQTYEFAYNNIGNIRFYLYSPDGMLTYPLPVKGFLSGKPQRFRTQTFSFHPESRFLIHTDGLELKEVKSMFSKPLSIGQLSMHLQNSILSNNDDITYVLGYLMT
ncbi:PP2C family serine/threonine-protein phosphatase [Bacillus songklensis]|uniref:PP2C family serine/threonine-protein phosphatase n=1 Tax=Bacillus songklensis TaxID=1069116 RepID=A0ABV8AWV9_9BACI